MCLIREESIIIIIIIVWPEPGTHAPTYACMFMGGGGVNRPVQLTLSIKLTLDGQTDIQTHRPLLQLQRL